MLRVQVERVLLSIASALVVTQGCSSDSGASAGDTVAAVNVSATPAPAAVGETVTVYKSPTCTCCTAWVDHLKQSGFAVVAIDTTDVDAVKQRFGVAREHAACHTAVVGGYVVEGHVPAQDIRRLLAEKPAITGLAVPGMPVGSPGMEGAYRQAYEVLAFTRGKSTSVFARH